jgi:hypothetical protein
MHNNGIVRHCYVFLLTQQFKQIRFYGTETLFPSSLRMQQLKQLELVTLLEPLLGNSPRQEQNVNIFTWAGVLELHIWCTCFHNGHKKAEMYCTTWPEFPKNEVVKSSWDSSTVTSALRTKQNEKCWSEIQLHTILQINYSTFILNPEQRRVFQLVLYIIMC